MTKSRILILLIGLWLFAIAAPSVVTLINPEKPVVVMNLNEEEQNEQGKKSIDEIKVVHGLGGFSLISELDHTANFQFYLAKGLTTSLEVILPPPEYS